MEIRYFVLVSLMCLSNFCNGRRHSRSRKGMRDKGNLDQGTCHLEVTCSGGARLPVRLPIRGPRGPPGPAGKKGDPGDPGSPGIPGKSGKSDSTRSGAFAFFVGLKDNINVLTQDADAVFENVVTNIGGAYTPETGRFTAPVNGSYSFTVVIAAQGKHKAAVMLMKSSSQTRLQNPTSKQQEKTSLQQDEQMDKSKNQKESNLGEAERRMGGEEMVLTVWAESIPFWSTASNTAILKLRQGQQVWLRILQRASHLHGYMCHNACLSFPGSGKNCNVLDNRRSREENGRGRDGPHGLGREYSVLVNGKQHCNTKVKAGSARWLRRL